MLLLSWLTVAAATVEHENCSRLDAVIRKDCGPDAAGGDLIVTKDECLGIGCCWDTTAYTTLSGSPIDSPWCFYPLYYSYYNDADLDEVIDFTDNATTTAATTPEVTTPQTTAPFVTEIEEIIVEKVVVEKITKPSSPAVVRPVVQPIASVVKPVATPAGNGEKVAEIDHGDLVTAYRKKTCQQLNESVALNDTMKALTMDRMRCSTVDFANFDASTDPNLNQDTAEGMRVLLNK